MSTPEWDCPAYGPEGASIGALCFIADLGERACLSAIMCGQVMAAERERVFARIQQQAAAGDKTAAYLLTRFTHPGQLLGGGSVEPLPRTDAGPCYGPDCDHISHQD